MLEHRVEDDEQHAVGGDDQEGRQAEGDDPHHDLPVKAAPPQGHRHLFPQQGTEHEGTGGHLGDDGGQSRARHIHLENKDKNGVQHNIEDGSQHHRSHAQAGIALGNEEAVHAGGHQGKEGTGGVDGQVGIGIAKGGRTCAEPLEQLALEQQEQPRQPHRQHQQHEKAVGEYPAGLLPISFPRPHGQDGRTAQPHQGGKGTEQGDDGAAHPYASQRQIPDLGDISDVNAVYDAVKYADQLGQHGGNGQLAHQAKNWIMPQIVGPFHLAPPSDSPRHYTSFFCARKGAILSNHSTRRRF